jgi:predicted RNase H-like HicB family nuclease
VTGYVVIIERDEAGGFSAWAPDLPGVIAAADSYDECVQLMREAIEFHLDGLRQDGEPIPAPAAVGAETIVAA